MAFTLSYNPNVNQNGNPSQADYTRPFLNPGNACNGAGSSVYALGLSSYVTQGRFVQFNFPVGVLPGSTVTAITLYADLNAFFQTAGVSGGGDEQEIKILYSLTGPGTLDDDTGYTLFEDFTEPTGVRETFNTLSGAIPADQDLTQVYVRVYVTGSNVPIPNQDIAELQLFGVWIEVQYEGSTIGLRPIPQSYIFLLPVKDTAQSLANQIYLGTFDSNDYNTEVETFWYFPVTDITEGTKPTTNRIRIKYRNIGQSTVYFGMLNQQNPSGTLTLADINETISVAVPANNYNFEQSITLGVATPQTPNLQPADRKIYTIYVSITSSGESPQLYMRTTPNSGPMCIISAALLGNQGEGEML